MVPGLRLKPSPKLLPDTSTCITEKVNRPSELYTHPGLIGASVLGSTIPGSTWVFY